MKDYYYILGVARTASPEEIRQAYHKLSLKFHPDRNDGDKFFEDRFKEINEAYEVRSEYVRAGNDFTMSKVPSGGYTLKVAFGNDWNPNLVSPCGSKGFFESNVSYSTSDGYSDVINVETTNDGYSIRYSTHTITLYPVADGNMSQRGIDATQFFR